jgi:hypothetical protein
VRLPKRSHPTVSLQRPAAPAKLQPGFNLKAAGSTLWVDLLYLPVRAMAANSTAKLVCRAVTHSHYATSAKSAFPPAARRGTIAGMSEEIIKCSTCGASVDSRALKCSNCGKAFRIPDRTSRPLSTPQAAAVALGIAIVALVVVFLLCAGCAIWLLLNYPALSVPRELRF